MSVETVAPLSDWTVADVLDRFGPISIQRIRLNPAPGTATEQDVVEIHDRESRLYELIDGVLVEKAMGVRESFLAGWILELLADHVRRGDLGIVLPPDGMARLAPGLVRIPDVSFIGWDRLPGQRVPDAAMLEAAPHLAVEVLSRGNTRREMQRKLAEYFDAGVSLVWHVDPRARTVQVFTSADASTTRDEQGTLDGGDVLPGFLLPVAKVFERLS